MIGESSANPVSTFNILVNSLERDRLLSRGGASGANGADSTFTTSFFFCVIYLFLFQ
jgi:hypothetical protein